ncbi:MAG: hypothetical protein JST85_22890 [Acidobacteria bacterium]|nr:hypothetical protein [Acidobacteriota bacterium]
MATKAAKPSDAPNTQELAVVVTADLAQIAADAETHPDEAAKSRILRCVGRLQDVVTGQMSGEMKNRLQTAAGILNQTA